MRATRQYGRVGPAGNVPAEQRVSAAGLVRTGRQYSVAATRFPACRYFPATCRSRCSPYRTPHGLRVTGENLWAPTPNEVGLGCMTEVVTSTTHSGAHIDALAHITLGEDEHWFGGANATEHLGDFGPTVGDAASLPPSFIGGVLLDVARPRGVDCLPAGSPVDAAEVQAVAAAQGVEIREWMSCCSVPAT